MIDIAANLQSVKERIAAAASGCGRDPGSVSLVAVSKLHPSEAIRAAYAAGQRAFGENYAQELRDKAAELEDLTELRWHFIGHLQRNKAKYAARAGAMVETVDSIKLVSELERQAERRGIEIPCLVQVNVGGEEQKSGCDSGEAEKLLGAIENAERLELGGLMTIPPFELKVEQTRRYFSELRRLRDSLGGPERLPHLSMGMSQDFEAAIEEGATLVRVGTAIFGPRPEACEMDRPG
ncbi:MAG: YggS family pyridoxal phosphate-dependent enzyme [Polyangia bacterium]